MYGDIGADGRVGDFFKPTGADAALVSLTGEHEQRSTAWGTDFAENRNPEQKMSMLALRGQVERQKLLRQCCMRF